MQAEELRTRALQVQALQDTVDTQAAMLRGQAARFQSTTEDMRSLLEATVSGVVSKGRFACTWV